MNEIHVFVFQAGQYERIFFSCHLLFANETREEKSHIQRIRLTALTWHAYFGAAEECVHTLWTSMKKAEMLRIAMYLFLFHAVDSKYEKP